MSVMEATWYLVAVLAAAVVVLVVWVSALARRVQRSEGAVLLLWALRDGVLTPEQVAHARRSLEEYERRVLAGHGGAVNDFRRAYEAPR